MGVHQPDAAAGTVRTRSGQLDHLAASTIRCCFAVLSCFYIPAAKDPVRYRTNAWLLIVARLIPASTFFIGAAVGFMPRGFVKLGIGDATIGIAALILLRMLVRARPV